MGKTRKYNKKSRVKVKRTKQVKRIKRQNKPRRKSKKHLGKSKNRKMRGGGFTQTERDSIIQDAYELILHNSRSNNPQYGWMPNDPVRINKILNNKSVKQQAEQEANNAANQAPHEHKKFAAKDAVYKVFNTALYNTMHVLSEIKLKVEEAAVE
jgi:hypothetical protein